MIYFMRADDDGPVKIGWSTNVAARAKQVRPTPDTILTVIRLIDGPRWVEPWFHSQFEDKRIKGEWFEFDAEMLTLEPPEIEPPREVPTSKDIHIWLTDEEAAELAARAKADDRSITNMARVYIRAGLLGVGRPTVETVGYSESLQGFRPHQAKGKNP